MNKEFVAARKTYDTEMRAAYEETKKNGKEKEYKIDRRPPGFMFSPRFLAIAEKNAEDGRGDRCPQEEDPHRPLGQGNDALDALVERQRRGVIEDWDVRFFPTIYVLDALGVIRHKDLEGEELEKAVNALLKETGEKTAGPATKATPKPAKAA